MNRRKSPREGIKSRDPLPHIFKNTIKNYETGNHNIYTEDLIQAHAGPLYPASGSVISFALMDICMT